MTDRKSSRREPKSVASGVQLSAGWAAAILALLVVLFFHDVFLGGKVFVSPDASAPAGFVRMGEKSLWHDHVYPLWNPYVFLGMPSFGSGAYNPLIYPPDWPLAIVQKVVPLPDETWLLLYYFLGGLFMFLLAREWGARAEAALLAGVGFVFAPNLVAVGAHGHGSQLVDSAYLPLMVWLATRWLRRGSLMDLGFLAFAGGFQMLRGHVQICFYTWLAIGLYAGVDWLLSLRDRSQLATHTARALALAAAAGLAFGIAGFYNLPLRDYARWSIRGGSDSGGGVGMSYATAWSLSPIELPSIVIPGFVGFGGATYWGGMPFTDYPNAYVGLVAVLLALPAFLAKPAPGGDAPRIFALVLAVFALLVAFGKNSPVYGLLYQHLPLFNKFRIPVMVILLFQLAAALGLAWGWSALLDGAAAPAGKTKRGESLQRLVLFTGAGMLILLLLAAASGSWHDGYVAMASAHNPAMGPQGAQLAFQGLVGDLWRGGFLGLLAVGAAWLALRGRWAPTIASLVALGLLLAELLPVSGRVMAPVIGEPIAKNLDAGRDDVVEFLEKAPGPFRVLPISEFQSNRLAGFGIASVGGYHAAKPRLIQDFLDDTLQFNLGWMRLLNVRYIISAQPLPAAPFLKEAFRGSQVIYENRLALPRVTLLDRYHVVQPARAILDSVKLGTSESGDVVFLEQDPHLKLGPLGQARASVLSYRLNDVTVDEESQGPAILRLADQWYPDWTATVDDRPAPVLKADYLLRAVAVPAGRHRVVFTYRSRAIRLGLMLSVVSAVFSLGLVLVGVWISRRGRTPLPAA